MVLFPEVYLTVVAREEYRRDGHTEECLGTGILRILASTVERLRVGLLVERLGRDDSREEAYDSVDEYHGGELTTR